MRAKGVRRVHGRMIPRPMRPVCVRAFPPISRGEAVPWVGRARRPRWTQTEKEQLQVSPLRFAPVEMTELESERYHNDRGGIRMRSRPGRLADLHDGFATVVFALVGDQF